MPELVYTPDKHPIDAVRVVPDLPITAGNNPVQAVRIAAETGSDVYTALGFPIRTVRLVDAAGLYTTSQTPITTQPEDVYTPDGNPIQAVRIIAGANSPELAWTTDRHPIEAVRLVDAAGLPLAGGSEEALWAAAVVVNGGTVSPARQALVGQFITAEKAAGTWALTDDYWPLWAENEPQALTSLKQRRLATVVAAPSFTPDRGYVFNGTTNYLNTLFVPSTHAVAMTGTNLRIAVYERTNLTTGAVSAGCTTSATAILYIGANSSGSLIPRTNISAGLSYPLSVNDSRGYSVVSRNGLTAAECFGYKNGVSLVQAGSVTFGATLPAQAIIIGAQNNNGTPANFRACSIGFFAVGAGLSSAQEAAQYTNVQALATAVGAQV